MTSGYGRPAVKRYAGRRRVDGVPRGAYEASSEPGAVPERSCPLAAVPARMPASASGDDRGAAGARGSGPGEPAATFETSPAAEDDKEADEADRPTGLLTVLALAAAVALAGLTVYLAYTLAGAPGAVEMVLVSVLALVIALAAMLPMRWGLYVVPGVAGAHYGLNVYNMVVTESSVYGFVPGDAFGYTLFTPLAGVLLGFALQGLYSAIVKA